MTDVDLDQLPVHPRTGLTAIGWRRNGAPIWPIAGASEDHDDGDGDADSGGGEGDSGGGEGDSGEGDADALGDAGKKALDAMKGKWRTERDRRKALEQQLAERGRGKPDSDDTGGEATDPEQVRAKAREEARAEVLRDRALDKVEAKAARMFADPEDARALLASRVDDFVDDGDVDVDAITEALEDLLKRKPHLAAQGGNGARRFGGGADGGARKGSGKPSQLTEADLKRMTPEQIVEAQAKGQFDDLLSGT